MIQAPNKWPKPLLWGIAFPLMYLNGWLTYHFIDGLQPLANYIITASLIAFLLDYPIRLLVKMGVPRILAIGLVLLLSVAGLSFLGITLVPLITKQFDDLLSSIPTWIESGKVQIQQWEAWAETLPFPLDLDNLADDTLGRLSSQLKTLSSKLVSLVVSTVGGLFNSILIGILTVLLVIFGGQVVDGLFSWIPKHWRQPLQRSLQGTFQSYFAGQGILALILSGALTIAFLVLDVPYGLLFGLAIGLTTLIPYASAVSTTLISALLGFQDPGLALKVLVVAVTIGQINDNVVAPRLLGTMTGLNPFWLVVALLLGGKYGGFLGLLLAVPVASFIKNTVDAVRSGQLAMIDSESERAESPLYSEQT